MSYDLEEQSLDRTTDDLVLRLPGATFTFVHEKIEYECVPFSHLLAKVDADLLVDTLHLSWQSTFSLGHD